MKCEGVGVRRRKIGCRRKWKYLYSMSLPSKALRKPFLHVLPCLIKKSLSFPSIGSYIPGMALLLGFYEKDERSDMQEISASAIAATEDSIDLKIQLPEVPTGSIYTTCTKLHGTYATNLERCIYTDVSCSLLSCQQYSICYHALPLPLRVDFLNATVNSFGPL